MTSKHFKYLTYVLKHKWFVFAECCKFGIPWRGLVHDLSKLRPSEWIPYVNYFYGDFPETLTVYEKIYHWKMKNKAVIESEFDIAWLKHQKRNKHHWQYWILREDNGETKVIKMPLKYVKEMLADWIGAGIAITGKREVKTWYLKNKEKMILHKETREWIERLLEVGK